MTARTRIPALIILMVLAAAHGVAAQSSAEPSRRDIKELLDVTGAAAMGAQMTNLVSGSMLDSLKQTRPDLPDRAVTLVKDTLTTEFANAFSGPGSIEEQLIDLYAMHFSADDIRTLLAFYTSPVGQKAVRAMPQLAQEGTLIGQKWSAANMTRIVGVVRERLRAEGLLP
jgi:hypothetical protein